MGILSTGILDIYKGSEKRQYFGVSSISTCPRETYYNYRKYKMVQSGEVEHELEHDLQMQLLLNDGHYQEAEIVDLLERAGFKLDYVGEKQAELMVGRCNIKGHPDGFILDGPNIDPNQPAMLEVKARNYQAFKKFSDTGLKEFPKIKAQTQLYMHANNLPYPVTEAHVIFKLKESVRLADVIEKADPSFAVPLIESVDRIIEDGYVPEPVENELCAGCRFSSMCWGSPTVDFSNFAYSDLKDASEKWMQGEAYTELGKNLKEEARAEFMHNMGDANELYTSSLRVKKSEFVQRRFDSKKFISINGQDAYDEYTNPVNITQVRVTPLDI